MEVETMRCGTPPTARGVTNFSVASSHKYTTGAGEQREETEWFNCSDFGRLAETCSQYFDQGQADVGGRTAQQPHLPDPERRGGGF